tara:strand:+ start:473 stop:811 length:339 start_codon:yes stop_codon:yes gene_type:complete
MNRRDLFKMLGGGILLQKLNITGESKTVKSETTSDDFYSMVSDMKEELKTDSAIIPNRYLDPAVETIESIYFDSDPNTNKLIRELKSCGVSYYRDSKTNKVRLFHLGKCLNG